MHGVSFVNQSSARLLRRKREEGGSAGARKMRQTRKYRRRETLGLNPSIDTKEATKAGLCKEPAGIDVPRACCRLQLLHKALGFVLR